MNNAQHGIKENYFKLKRKDMEDNNLLKKVNKKQGKGKKYIKKSVLQKRLEINKAASKQFIAEVDLPIPILSPPHQTAVTRDVYEDHIDSLQFEMETAVQCFPLKPSVVVVYKVIN